MSREALRHKNQILTDFLPVVPEEQQSAAYRLFHIKYKCQVAQVHTETLEYLEMRPVAGNEYQGAGRLKAQELQQVNLTAAAMAEMVVQDGATIVLNNRSDAMTIYNLIKQHLKDWQLYQLTSIHGRKIPVDDLHAFDQFAAIIYPFARGDIEKSGSDMLFAGTPLAELLRGRGGGFGGFSRFNKNQQQRVMQDARGSEEVPMQHDPMLQGIIDPKIRKTRWETSD